ncbi:MAG: hypothetical protein ABSE49_32795 [Polyangiaceae bacterium]|jgi:hypothetical protein
MLGTKAKVLLAVVIVGAAAFLVMRRSRSAPTAVARPASSQETGHAVEIDHAMAAVLALQHAPEGATPCESAYNAYKASKDVSDTQAVKAVVQRLAPRDEFLAKCAELPPGAQACLVPRYLSAHRQECVMARASSEQLSPMVELLQRTAPIDDSPVLPVLPAPSAPAP